MSPSENLSRTYERYLRLYPKRWRQRYGLALVGTMIDIADAENREHPSVRDRLDLLQGAFHARSSFWDPNGRLAEIALGLGLGGGLVYLSVSWDPHHRGGVGPFANPTFIAVAAWLAAYFVSLAHRPAATRWYLATALVLHTTIEIVGSLAPVHWLGPSLSLTALFIGVGVIAIARPIRRRGAITTAALIPGLLIAATSTTVELLTS